MPDRLTDAAQVSALFGLHDAARCADLDRLDPAALCVADVLDRLREVMVERDVLLDQVVRLADRLACYGEAEP